MRRSTILAKIRSGQPVRLAALGYFLPPFIAYAAHEGYDGVWLDLEHHAMNTREVQALLAFAHRYDIDCLVRPPSKEKTRLYRYLEDGAAGLMIQHVATPEDVRNIVDNVRFPPLGDRGIEGFGFETDFGIEVSTLVAEANQETVLLIQIETPEAVRNVEEIAAIPGVDGLYIGPADLGLRMAHEPSDQQLDITAVMQRVAAACDRHDKVWGRYTLQATDIAEQIALGARVLIWGADFHLLKQGLSQCRTTLDTLLQHTLPVNE